MNIEIIKKSTGLALLVSFLLLAETPVYAECVKGDCRNGKGILIHSDGRHYSGDFSSGAIEGNGVLKFPNGTIYIGEFVQGVFHGQGVLSSKDGRKYEGEFSQNVINGSGTLRSADGTVYKGEFLLGQYQGKGTLTYTDGRFYEGEFRSNMAEGHGKLTALNSTWFEGENFITVSLQVKALKPTLMDQDISVNILGQNVRGKGCGKVQTETGMKVNSSLTVIPDMASYSMPMGANITALFFRISGMAREN